ncbi:MAG: hypothetical protein IKP36_05290 [Bacteroidaceae bacterium]|nr:hypothetical protein [Bacteroidaceae bacterium]
MANEKTKEVLRSLWHPATKSPGKKYVYVLFKVKGHKVLTCELIRFLSEGVTPATVAFKMSDGTPKLAVAWAYAEELACTITDGMIAEAKSAAWAWYKEEEAQDEED